MTEHLAETDALRAIRDLHADVHQCVGGWWWNPQRKRGASIAEQGPCPTLALALAALGEQVSPPAGGEG